MSRSSSLPLTSSVRALSNPRESEEARRFVQERLALLGLVTFALSGGFLIVSFAGEVVLDGMARAAARLAEPRRYLNGVGALVSASLWLSMRSRRPRPPSVLLVGDGVATLSAAALYTLMAQEQGGLAGVLMTALTVMLVLLSRALMVPSPAARTLGIGASAAVGSFGVAAWNDFGGSAGAAAGQDYAHLFLNLGSWLGVAIAISTIASWVLFGLRREVREARRLGQYVLREKLGEGGMGVVYRADHALLKRPTAVKLLLPSRSGDVAAARFEREVQLTAKLIHPNTVTIFDYGHTPDGYFYYAMEYLDGADLEQLVNATGPLHPARVIHLLAQAAAGLAEAHEIGLIHRDIKPANILVASAPPVADLVKVVDFGLVRELEGTGETLTRTDTLVGTPLYLAPEAITAPEDVDVRIDIYALGAVGYFLLTAEHVFTGSTIVEICSHHLHTAPIPPSERVHATIPDMLEEVLLDCLSKDPADRPQSAGALRDLLLACQEHASWEQEQARQWWAEHGAQVIESRERFSLDEVAPTILRDPDPPSRRRD